MEIASSAIIQPFPGQDAEQWISAYRDEVLANCDTATIATYTRILHRFADWLVLERGWHSLVVAATQSPGLRYRI